MCVMNLHVCLLHVLGRLDMVYRAISVYMCFKGWSCCVWSTSEETYFDRHYATNGSSDAFQQKTDLHISGTYMYTTCLLYSCTCGTIDSAYLLCHICTCRFCFEFPFNTRDKEFNHRLTNARLKFTWKWLYNMKRSIQWWVLSLLAWTRLLLPLPTVLFPFTTFALSDLRLHFLLLIFICHFWSIVSSYKVSFYNHAQQFEGVTTSYVSTATTLPNSTVSLAS